METVTLVSSDSQTFEVPRAVADSFGTVKNLLGDCDGAEVPLPNVTGTVLAKVLEYATFHAAERGGTADDKTADDKAAEDKAAEDKAAATAFDKAYVVMAKAELYDVILAANYLNHAALLDLVCQAVADMVSGKTPEEIRAEFGIENDFTPDEEAQIRAQNQWAFD